MYAKSAQTLSKVDRQSKTLQNLQQHCKLAVQRQTFSLHKTNAIAKPDSRLCPTDRCAIRKKRFWILLPSTAKVSSVSPSRGRRGPLLHGREMVLLLCDQKYHPVPLLREAEISPWGDNRSCPKRRILQGENKKGWDTWKKEKITCGAGWKIHRGDKMAGKHPGGLIVL